MVTSAQVASLLQVRALVEEIRAFVQGVDQTNDPRLAESARRYADACLAANARLRRCGEFLQSGHRTEALGLVEADPDLLALVGALSFGELDLWQELTASYGWERAQPLRNDTAAALNEAYVVERRLAPWLKRHRYLALARGSIAERLSVLRQIAADDHTSPIWREDILMLERERAAELLALGRTAVNACDYQLMAQFVHEYAQEPWLQTPEAGLLTCHAQAISMLHIQRTLPRLAQEIGIALQRRDLAAVTALVARWNSALAEVRKAIPNWALPLALHDLVQPAIDWLQACDNQRRTNEFRADLTLLHSAITNGASPEQVATLLAKVESYGFEIPPYTRQEIDRHRLSEKAAGSLNTAVIMAVLLAGVVGSVIAFFIVRGIMSN